MIRSSVYALLALAMVGQTISSVVPPSEPDNFEEPSHAVQLYTDVVLENVSEAGESGDASAVVYVTPYSYKAVMLQNSKDGRKVPCWRCGNPCSHGFCCDDGYPQCCLVDGYCRCCRR